MTNIVLLLHLHGTASLFGEHIVTTLFSSFLLMLNLYRYLRISSVTFKDMKIHVL